MCWDDCLTAHCYLCVSSNRVRENNALVIRGDLEFVSGLHSYIFYYSTYVKGKMRQGLYKL